ncbi:ABC transporter ATP-binding protein [Microbacterium betulae]|uniref:ABC transporter ATP-binding protein n=1 Tax=Microbacterium betulae TaxID=2981139 RepID=A0AA97FG68_9MICO|nr:ABC transporter ATP-binding protein [Microbacterium sp. AB]WOF21874.1 ABC transporter ATP-binding protein [Microbacterium sp. AB]
MTPAVRRLAGLAADVPVAGWLVVVCAVVRTLAASVVALAAGRGVDAVLDGRDPALPLAVAASALVLAALIGAAEGVLPAVAQGSEERRWRAKVVRAQLGAPIDADESTGTSVARATEEVERFAHYRASFLGPLIGAVVVPVVVLVVIAVFVSAGVAFPLAVCVALIPPLVAWFMTRFRTGSGRFRMISGRLTAAFLETIRALGVVRLLGAEGQRRAALAAQAEALRSEAMRLLRRNQIVLLVTDAVFGVVMLSLVGVLAVAGVSRGALTAGTAFALLMLTVSLREPVDRLGRSFYVGLAGRAAGERVRAVAEDPVGGRGVREPGAPAALDGEDVRVERGGRMVVDGADLAIGEGLTVVVGPSGAGKSSLALALSGLVPASGIRLDGEPATPADLREVVSYVPQRSTLFTGSVRENLLLGGPGASDDELRDVLVAAGFPRGGAELPDGLSTSVGEGARGVSGGQAQRISIARALLTGRDVLVADEPTAQLDPASAAQVVETLRRVARRGRVVLITHRVAEAEDADRVTVVEAGRVTHSGPLDAVRRESGFLAAAFAASASDASEADGRDG